MIGIKAIGDPFNEKRPHNNNNDLPDHSGPLPIALLKDTENAMV
jgi:hypothetical protein